MNSNIANNCYSLPRFRWDTHEVETFTPEGKRVMKQENFLIVLASKPFRLRFRLSRRGRRSAFATIGATA